MTDPVVVRPDVRLDDAPMQPLRCGGCGATVEVRKSSWAQTSIQWDAGASAACLERRASSANPFRGCASLQASVRAATERGDLQVVGEEPLTAS